MSEGLSQLNEFQADRYHITVRDLLREMRRVQELRRVRKDSAPSNLRLDSKELLRIMSTKFEDVGTAMGSYSAFRAMEEMLRQALSVDDDPRQACEHLRKFADFISKLNQPRQLNVAETQMVLELILFLEKFEKVAGSAYHGRMMRRSHRHMDSLRSRAPFHRTHGTM